MNKYPKKTEYTDSGADYNQDNHCDIDGWFVNYWGNHRAITRIPNENKSEFRKYAVKVNDRIFPKRVVDSLQAYSADDRTDPLSSPSINYSLRTGKYIDKAIENAVQNIDKAITRRALPKPFETFRGINAKDGTQIRQVLDSLEKGSLYRDKAYMSTSLRFDHASKYATEGSGSIYLLKIRINKSFKGILLSTAIDENGRSSAKYSDECELLLARDTVLRVLNRFDTRSETGQQISIITMEYVN